MKTITLIKAMVVGAILWLLMSMLQGFGLVGGSDVGEIIAALILMGAIIWLMCTFGSES